MAERTRFAVIQDSTSRAMKMVPCERCRTPNFIPANLGAFKTAACQNCGHKVMTPVRLQQFELRSVIGEGGMATVFRAFDTVLERDVAVKMLQPEIAADAANLENFYREARYQACLNHTNIVQIYNYGEIQGYKYLVMEVADQGSLDDRIEDQGKVEELYVLDVGIKISSALELVRQKKLIHLDIKPGNILYNRDNEPKLTDFGIAKRIDAKRDTEEGILGTPYYIAPERVELQMQDFRSDMYSLAATLYHAMVGRVPYDADSVEDTAWAHVHNTLTPPRKIDSNISKETEAVVMRAMEKKPDNRYTSYADFAMALESARSHLLVKKFGR